MVTRLMFTRIVLGLALMVVVPATLAATTPVGATAGSFAVNQNGGATYTIPITAPPGTAGMVPNLTLTYDKQVQNDLLGVGWSVRGLSLIQRCGRTIALDGLKGGVNYDANDRFCLDGQRLIAINNGIYGANSTEYRTEKEIFSRIISYRDDTTFTGNGPQYFRVTSKSGMVMEYGVTLDSRIEAQGKVTVRLWALNKVQDTKGNYLTVSYFEDNTNGEYRPTRIDYTGNANAALTPYNSIQFVYAPRTDITPHYEGGSIIKTTQRVTNIQSYTDATLVRDYQLAYDNNGAVGRSRLTSVTECGSDGVCLPATNLGWSLSASDSFTYKGSITPYSAWNSAVTGDFNGDGKTDYLINTSDAGWFVYLSNGDGTFTYKSTLSPYSAWYNPTLGDFNGDGNTDILINTSNAGWFVYLSNGDGTFTYKSTLSPYSAWYSPTPGDFNGDGNTDILINTSNAGWFAYLSNGDGTFTYKSTLSPYSAWNSPTPGDFDGDGKTDILINTTNAGDRKSTRL